MPGGWNGEGRWGEKIENINDFFSSQLYLITVSQCITVAHCIIVYHSVSQCIFFVVIMPCFRCRCLVTVVRTDSLKGRRGRLPSKPKNVSESSSRAASRRSSACSVSSSGPKVDVIGCLLRAHQECVVMESAEFQVRNKTASTKWLLKKCDRQLSQTPSRRIQKSFFKFPPQNHPRVHVKIPCHET